MAPSEYDIGASGCVEAFRSVKAGKNVFMWIVLLAILGQLATFVLVQFVGVLDPLNEPPAEINVLPRQAEMEKAEAEESAAETQPTQLILGKIVKTIIPEAQTQETGTATMWEECFRWCLPAMKFFAFVSCLLVVLTLMFSVKLSIIGRLGGIGGFMSAFFWSLILLAMITPWQQVLAATYASGALYNLGELTSQVARVKGTWGASAGVLEVTLFYARFAAYPIIAMLVWIAVMAKFSRGYKDSLMSPVGTIPVERPAEPQG